MTLILARLTDGYSEDDLKLAAFGCAKSRFHQGENDRRQVYDSVELIYRNGDKVDTFIRLGEQAKADERREREAERERQRLAESMPGEGYRRSRSTILSLVRKTA